MNDPTQDGAASNNGANNPNESRPRYTPPRPAVLDRLNGYFNSYTGRNGTDQELNQWGTNIDSNYENTIRNAIYNTDEAKAYRAKQNAPKDDAPKTEDKPTAPTQTTGSPVTANGQIQPQQANPVGQAAPIHVNIPQAYSPGAMPDAYKGYQFGQFQAPNQSGVNGQQDALVSAILSNPETMNPNVVAQLKEQNKSGALLMRDQLLQQSDAGAVARGAVGSGAVGAANNNLNADLVSKILNGNAGVDIQAAQTNRQNQLDALTAAEQIAQGQMGRATSGYGTQLAGQSAQAGDNRAASDAAMQRALAIEQQKQAAYDSQYRNANLDLLGQSTQNNSVLDYLRYMENQRQFNGQLGFNYNQLDQNGQLSMLDFLFR